MINHQSADIQDYVEARTNLDSILNKLLKGSDDPAELIPLFQEWFKENERCVELAKKSKVLGPSFRRTGELPKLSDISISE